MAIPTRLVCANCLASVESSGGGDFRGVSICPVCSSPLENAFSLDTDQEETTDIPQGEAWVSPDASTPPQRKKVPVERIGRFQLKDWIGGGGYGDVYLAYDPRLDRDIALKVLKTTKLDQKARERFLREAHAAARLNHPNIVGLHDAGEDDGRLWIAYQLVRGKTLSKLRAQRTLTLNQIVMIVRDLALALDHAHKRGITHRDIKPANVIIDAELHAHLTDFGLARRIDLESELTGEGTILGTPAYMSPEQAAGRASLADGRTDIYSLGVILYELLCGVRPSDVPSNTPIWKVKQIEPLPTPHTIDQHVPMILDKICMKALALNPEDRYADGKSLARELDAWLQTTIEHEPEAIVPRTPKRTRVALMGIAATVIVAGGIAIFSGPGETITTTPPNHRVGRYTPPDSSRPTSPNQVEIPGPNPERSPLELVPEDARTEPSVKADQPRTSKSAHAKSHDPNAQPLNEHYSGAVVVVESTHKIHKPSCSSLRNVNTPPKEYPSLADATQANPRNVVCKTCAK